MREQIIRRREGNVGIQIQAQKLTVEVWSWPLVIRVMMKNRELARAAQQQIRIIEVKA